MADEFEAAKLYRGSFGWSSSMEDMNLMTGMKKRSSFHDDGDNLDDDDQPSPSVCDNSMVLLDFHNNPHRLIDSGFTSSSTTTYDWNNGHFSVDGKESSESKYNSMEQEDMTNYRQSTNWNYSKNFTLIGEEDYSTIAKCQSLPITNFPLNSSLNPYSYNSSVVQSLFEYDHNHDQEPQPPQSFYETYQFPPSFPKVSPDFTKNHTPNNLQFSSGLLPFWTNAPAPAPTVSSHPSQILNPTNEVKPNCVKVMKSSNGSTFKRPRIETPSPLPTFKVRKEKLGDRITALQQLVSPFGKTDTASVLHEAIEYIKHLHDQVSVLSSPYMKSGPDNVQHQQISRKMKDTEVKKQDLITRGLCLVPISSTYPVANESVTDFWTPTFGGTFR